MPISMTGQVFHGDYLNRSRSVRSTTVRWPSNPFRHRQLTDRLTQHGIDICAYVIGELWTGVLQQSLRHSGRYTSLRHRFCFMVHRGSSTKKARQMLPPGDVASSTVISTYDGTIPVLYGMSPRHILPAAKGQRGCYNRDMEHRVSFITLALVVGVGIGAVPAISRAASSGKPNILIILADDLGYGDVQCYNPQRGKIPTPNMDRLAAEGMRFTDAHSSSGVCSPSRYALLTGRYHWRTRLQQGIVPVWGAPLIAPDRLTVAGLAKQHGYRTACIGKWHLGRDWPITEQQRKYFTGFGGQAGGGGQVSTTVTDAHRADMARRLLPTHPRRADHARLRRVLRHRRAQLAAVLLHRERPHRRHPERAAAGGEAGDEPGQPARARAAGLAA